MMMHILIVTKHITQEQEEEKDEAEMGKAIRYPVNEKKLSGHVFWAGSSQHMPVSRRKRLQENEKMLLLIKFKKNWTRAELLSQSPKFY